MEHKNWLNPINDGFNTFKKVMDNLLPGILGYTFGKTGALVKENEDEIIVTADFPGFDRQDLDITIGEKMVIIKGEKRGEESGDGKNGCWSKHSFRKVLQTVPLPQKVISEQVQVNYGAGSVELRIPKMAAKNKKKEGGLTKQKE